jgi:hypothetical protein
MRATEPWRFARMRRGWGSRSLILDCSIEGPRGAKPRPSEQVDVVGDGGAERPPFPWPSRTVSISALVAGGCSAVQCGAARRVPSRNSASGESSCMTLSISPTTAWCECEWCGLQGMCRASGDVETLKLVGRAPVGSPGYQYRQCGVQQRSGEAIGGGGSGATFCLFEVLEYSNSSSSNNSSSRERSASATRTGDERR